MVYRTLVFAFAFIVVPSFALGEAHPSTEVLDLRTRTDGADWPDFLGTNRDATSSETGIRSWPTNGPAVRWQQPAGEGYAAPSVAKGRLFFFDRHDDKARLTCLESETGKELWRSEYPTSYEDMYGYSGGPRNAPVVDGDRVYVYGVDGRLRCHRVTDGSVLWEHDINAQFNVKQNFFGVGSTPLIDGDRLIVPVGGSPKDSPGIQDGTVGVNGTGIVAFDKRTGEERYRLGDELASYSSPVIATLGKSRIGLYFARGGLLGFDPDRGTERFHLPWRAKINESVNAATPVIVGDQVFITETYGPGGALLQLQADGPPKILWQDERRKRSLASHWNTPVLHDGYLYGSSGRNSGDAELRCVELATGEVKWAEKGLNRSTLLLVDGHLVVLTEYGRLLLVRASPEAYEAIAETELQDADGKALLRHPAWNAPVLAQGLLYLRGKDRLVAVELIPAPETSSVNTAGDGSNTLLVRAR